MSCVSAQCAQCNEIISDGWPSTNDVITLRASCGVVYCNRSCLWVCGCVCLFVCLFVGNYHDNSKLRASIPTKLMHGFVGKDSDHLQTLVCTL